MPGVNETKEYIEIAKEVKDVVERLIERTIG